jgi:hypothetical protein
MHGPATRPMAMRQLVNILRICTSAFLSVIL